MTFGVVDFSVRDRTDQELLPHIQMLKLSNGIHINHHFPCHEIRRTTTPASHMSGGRITVDGLWRCLCPSFDETILSRAVTSGFPRTTARRQPRPRIGTVQWQQQARRITNPAVANQDPAVQHGQDVFNVTKHTLPDNPPFENNETTTAETLLHDASRTALQNAPTPVIYETLRLLQGKIGSRNRLRAFVKYLVAQRDQKPNGFLYEALIASNCDPAGSAREVRDILGEMTRLGIEPTASLYRVALKALANHPDYLLRNRILSEMKGKWMDPGVEGRCSVALGLLREGQTEMALGKLDEMVEEKLDVPGWVYDVFVVVLAQTGGIDEAIGLLRRRMGMDGLGAAKISRNIWYLLLDEASRGYHYEGTRLVWDQMVASNTIIPSDGICLNILNTASRYSDPQLATDVIKLLSSRNVKLGIHHYEALVDCYANRDDVENALNALCIMANAGLAPENASTRSIYLAFKRVPALVGVASDALLRLREMHVIPLPALNVVIQGLCLIDDHPGALDLYMQVRSLCACRPEAYTYSALIETSDDPKIVQFLVAEMLSFGLQPSRDLNDRVVANFLARDDLDSVFDHLASIAEVGLMRESWISRNTAIALAKRCFAEKDERVWGLLDTAEGLGLEMGEVTRYLADDGSGGQFPPESKEAVQLGVGEVAKEVPTLPMDANLNWAAMEKASEAGSG
jgi:hypothetical protein